MVCTDHCGFGECIKNRVKSDWQNMTLRINVVCNVSKAFCIIVFIRILVKIVFFFGDVLSAVIQYL